MNNRKRPRSNRKPPTKPPKTTPRLKNHDDGLCTSIDVTKVGDFKWRLTWKAQHGPGYPMVLSRIEMHQLLQSLVRLQSQCKWDITIAYSWINRAV